MTNVAVFQSTDGSPSPEFRILDSLVKASTRKPARSLRSLQRSRRRGSQAGPVFDLDYREVVTLPAGERVVLRVPRPGDRDLFQRGFLALSPASRHHRFLMTKNHLSSRELDYLTTPDGDRHYAIGAVALSWRGQETSPVGVGRLIREAEDGGGAEFAVVVVDAWQNRGVGRLLLQRLLLAARERGVEQLHGQVMADNAPLLHLLRHVPDRYLHRLDGGVIQFDVPVSVPLEAATAGR